MSYERAPHHVSPAYIPYVNERTPIRVRARAMAEKWISRLGLDEGISKPHLTNDGRLVFEAERPSPRDKFLNVMRGVLVVFHRGSIES